MDEGALLQFLGAIQAVRVMMRVASGKPPNDLEFVAAGGGAAEG
jgi:hypothetical protein